MAYCIKINEKYDISHNKQDKTGLYRIFLFAFILFYDIIKTMSITGIISKNLFYSRRQGIG